MGCKAPNFQLELMQHDPVMRESFQKIQAYLCDPNGLLGLISDQISGSSTPGFSYGKSGNVVAGAYFENNGVPSNKASVPVPVELGRIARIAFSNENISTCDLLIQQHDGNGVGLTNIITVSVVGVRNKVFDFVSTAVNVTPGRCIAVSVSSGSCKNGVAAITLLGAL